MWLESVQASPGTERATELMEEEPQAQWQTEQRILAMALHQEQQMVLTVPVQPALGL